MDEKVHQLLDCKSRISNAFTNYKKSPKDRIRVSYIQARLESLEQLWNEYYSGHQDLLKSFNSATLKNTDYFKYDVYEDVYEAYIEYKCELKDVLSGLQTSIPVQLNSCNNKESNSKSNNIKLPKICIPSFSGSYTEWISFRDLFVSLIHTNKEIDDVQKLHYLKAHLTGEAEQLLRHIPITNDSYAQCWKLLEGRYNNKQYLGNCILKRFFAQKTLLTESATDIKSLLDTTTETLNALTNLGIDTGSWDIIVIYIMCQKLDPESRKLWECKVSENANISTSLPTIKHFKDFLQTRYHSLEFLDSKPSCNKPKYNNISGNSYKGNFNVKSATVPMFNNLHVANVFCSFCKGEHRIMSCKDFIGLNINAKRDFIQNNGLCFNCLGNSHSVRYCKNPSSCNICHRRHHTLIHDQDEIKSAVHYGSADNQVAQVHTHQGKEENAASTSLANHFVNEHVQQVLLATAVVEASSFDREERQLLRVLIDQGSQASFITSAAVQLLGLKKTSVKGLISGLGGKETVIAKATVEVTITSRVNSGCALKVKAYVLDKLTSQLPSARVSLDAWPELKTVNLADPEFYIPNKVDMLLGAEVYAQIIGKGIMKSPPRGSLVAQETIMGWILSGQVDSSTNVTCNVITMHAQIEELLRSFWEIESEPSNKKKILTVEEKRCEEFYQATTTRDENGRYVVRLPFRDDEPACVEGNSRDIALRRLNSLEKKLHRDAYLKSEYGKVFLEYLDLGHMVPLSKEETETKGLYLPYHAVVREDRETTKVRIVFDASCKGTNGVSLNDDLLVGPRLQPDLRHIIMRWRMHPVCFISDIVKMYRQVAVDERDTKYQRILWRENAEDEVKEYKMQRLTFGLSSAPYLAVKSLCQIAIDEGEEFPLAAPRVLQDFYMDDLMSGCQSDEEAIEVYKQMTELLSKGGFILQKWSSNSEFMLAGIKEKIESKEGDKKIEIKADEVNKILGLTWNRNLDEFAYAVQLPPVTKPVTKRTVISDISKLYDPLGWVAPSVIRAKIFIQKLWLAGLDWDQELEPRLLEEWLSYRENLSELTKFRLNRWTNQKIDATSVELHGFCDASTAAYAAVVYLRVIDSEGNVHVSLITGKTRVSAIKQQSVPRLELNGAVLLAKLLTEVADVLSIPRASIHGWTDSEIVLAWLSSHPSKWKTFIGNRVSEILTVMDRNQWAHVQSEHNPADCASRGISPAELINHRLWKRGPEWLGEKTITYTNPRNLETTLEKRTIRTHLATSVTNTDINQDSMWFKFSSLTKLLRVVSYCRRFLKLKERKPAYLLTEELKEALEIIIKKCQAQAFGEDMRDLQQGKLKKKSKLISFFPQIDERGILRVGGRLERAAIDYGQKHPVLLPKSSWLTELIIRDAHYKTLHGGPPLMTNYIRSKYYILGLKSLVKHYVRKCVPCIRHAANIRSQLMGQLPSSRVNMARAFLRSGVDYAGPINLRVSKGRGTKSYKGYICLFVCMATRAIHLEAVSDLSSAGFLAAFKRFVARRGYCSDIYSDNGSNFQGASKELKHLFNAEISTLLPEIADWMADKGTQWHFIPPYAPNFGGLWEAGIKSWVTLTPFVRHWQPAVYERVRRRRAAPESPAHPSNTLRLSFRAHNRDFTLLLKPDTSSVFAEGAQFHSSAGPLDYTAQVYTGKLADDDSSEVYGVITADGLFDGTIWTATEEYYVEPLSRYDASHPSMHSVVYRRSDVDHPHDNQPTLCASHQLHLKRQQGSQAELFNFTKQTLEDSLNNTEDLTKEINRRKKRWLPEDEMQDDEPKKNPELPLDLDVPYTSNSDFDKLSTRKPKIKIDKSNLITKVRLDSEETRPSKPKTHVEVIKTKAGVVTVSKDIVKKEPVGYTVLTGNGTDDGRHVNKRATVDPRKTTCLVYLQADHMFYQRYGSEEACIEVMTRHVQKVNAIYKVTDFNQDGKPDNITFMIKRIKVHTLDAMKDPAYRFPNNYGVEKYLELFSEEDYDAFCLAYMFTYRDFEMGTLGLAWTGDLKNAGGVCEKNGHYRGSMKSLNTGIVTLLNYGKHVPPAVSHVTLAHEIGHNFGSPHDPEVCTPFGEDGNYIMFARATSGDRKNNNKFSPCSLRAIDPVLNNKARSPKGCFTEPQPAICGNGVVEEGEECDCGWASECTDVCCRPQAARPHYKPCTLTEHSVCSPSQGPCCTASCTLKFGDKCRSDNGCRDAAHCDGKRAACPASRHKPNRTRCDKELVCFMGECTGSICLAYGLESCQCAPRKDDPRSACELCCRKQGGACVSSFHWNTAPFDVPDMYAKPGTPCNDYNGYCDVFQRCREVDPSGPLATLRKLLLSDESIAGFKRWMLRHWYAVLLILLAVVALLVASTRFLGRHGKKLKSVTIIHSSTTETVRLPDAADPGGLIVHTAVRSKLPLKKKVALRTKAYRNKKDHKNKQGDKASPAHAGKKRKPSHPAKPEEAAKVTKESTVVVTNAEGKSPKHVLLSKHKAKIKKRKSKIKKETIDYSSMQKHPSTPTKDTEALTKVQKWLLSSPQPTVIPKSKSIPLGLTERTHRQVQKGTRKTRPSKSATNLLSGEKARLQVVFKPPFRFSVKICKSDKTKVVLDKSSKPDLDRKRQEATPQMTSSADHAKSNPSQNKLLKHSNSTKNDVDTAAPTCPKPTDRSQNQDSGHRYANLPRSASDCKLVKNIPETKTQNGHKKSNSVGQRKETTESRQNLIAQEDGDYAHVYENVVQDALVPKSCSMPRRQPAAGIMRQASHGHLPRAQARPQRRGSARDGSAGELDHFYNTIETLRRGPGAGDTGTGSSSGSSRRDAAPRTSRQNSLVDRPRSSPDAARLKRQMSENELGERGDLRGFRLVVGKDRLKRQLSANELGGSRVQLAMPMSAGAEPRQFCWNKRASLDCEASLPAAAQPRAGSRRSAKRTTYTFGELKHTVPDAAAAAADDGRGSPEEFLGIIDD